MMKKALITLSAMGLAAFNLSALAADGAELAEACLDCHEFAYDFEGVDAAEMEGLISARLENKKHKATIGLSPEDVKALSEYIAAEAAK